MFYPIVMSGSSTCVGRAGLGASGTTKAQTKAELGWMVFTEKVQLHFDWRLFQMAKSSRFSGISCLTKINLVLNKSGECAGTKTVAKTSGSFMSQTQNNYMNAELHFNHECCEIFTGHQN